ncbi:MAG TPA: OFA family MFS transporter [Candidatus Caenarcaniphilales bacterium]|nr:OFA family MFS transporter [Candidatus Caenarcaniphilales bacterium]
MNEGAGNRWLIAAAGVVMQLALGAVYAWSVFRKPLAADLGATVKEVNLVFGITIFTLGAAAYFGGLWMGRSGPRVVAITAGVLYGIGILGASFAEGNLALLYLTYGVIAGIGIGLGYIVPVATLIKWFPDKRGMITGIAVAGFGGGALITAPLAESLIRSTGSPYETFRILGIGYLIAVVAAALFIRNPPEGYRPEGWQPSEKQAAQRTAVDYDIGGALRTWQWFALWTLLFLNVLAGISILAEASPMAQEITGASAATAAGVVGIISIANAAGRFLWASLSDVIGRRFVFLTMYLVQAVAFFLLAQVDSFALFTVIAFVILTAYGGGFGTMPAFAADYFGPTNVGKIYGLMLTAWGTAGLAGPYVISAVRDATGTYKNGLLIIAGVMLVSAILPFIVRPPRPAAEEASEAAAGAPAGAQPAASR